MSNITGVHKDNPLPDSESNQDLADKFADYFMEKINKTRDALKDKPLYQPTCRNALELNIFNPVAEDEVTKSIKKLATKSCELDSIPTKLLKEIIDILITPITEFINLSLKWKTSIIRPLLKRQALNLFPLIIVQSVTSVFCRSCLKKQLSTRLTLIAINGYYCLDINLHIAQDTAVKRPYLSS